MKIVNNDNRKIELFGNLNGGDVFQFIDDEGSIAVCMVLYAGYQIDTHMGSFNYVSLNSGRLAWADETDEVIVVNATLTINPNN